MSNLSGKYGRIIDGKLEADTEVIENPAGMVVKDSDGNIKHVVITAFRAKGNKVGEALAAWKSALADLVG